MTQKAENLNIPLHPSLDIAGVSGSTDIFGTIMTCLPKYSNCQLCKYMNESQNSDVCIYCAKHNKSTEYYR